MCKASGQIPGKHSCVIRKRGVSWVEYCTTLLPRSHVEGLTPKVMVFEDGAFGRSFCYKKSCGWGLQDGISGLTSRGRERLFSLLACTGERPGEERGRCHLQADRKLSPETESASTLSVNFQPPEP